MKLTTARTRLMTVVVVCLFLATLIVPVLGQGPVEKYTYSMAFDHDGLTTVEILYNCGFVGSGASWIAVPKNFTETTIALLKGTITSMARVAYRSSAESIAHPFYDNLTFSFASGSEPFSMRLGFNMTNGAMIVEPNGFFYSPQIGAPSSANVQVRLTFPDGVTALDEVQPAPAQVETSGPTVKLSFNPSSQSRIAVTFKVSWAQETSHIQKEKVQADVPSRYLNLGTEIVELYKNAVPLMDDLFNGTVDRISMKFFTPSTLPELSIGGYTPIDPSSFQAGAIYLNLFYFRAQAGTMETIAMHELTHQYEAHSEISSQLLWVQEGLANYVAVQMGRPLNYDFAPTDADLEATASELNGNYGMIQYWQPGGTAGSLYQYYAASYDVFKTLGDKYGGLPLLSRFFAQLRGLENGLTSTNVAVYELSLAARIDLLPLFTKWGFELVDLSGISARIVKLRTEAELLGPLLPFREEALSQLEQAQSSIYASPEAAAGHITIATFYIETVPMIIAGLLIALVLIVAVAAVVGKRSKKRRIESAAT